MELKAWLVVFGTVFLAELGDKTQLATVLFAANRESSVLGVFLAASAALITATALAVAAGSQLAHYVNARHLSMLAGAGFVAIGMWTLWSAIRGS
jgi:putative Ca2+/H+ antiporter (TMEM165/GDT1 family)